MSSTWKSILTLSIFGESHGPAIGMTLDGLPAGENIDPEELQTFLNRRAPGRSPQSTPRREGDVPEFLSGLKDGKTTGAPLAAIIRNTNTRSADYGALQDVPRPGHADYTAHVKYGGRHDHAGGGHFSGRLTAPLCIAGGICLQILERRGVEIAAEIVSIGGVTGSEAELMAEIDRVRDAGDSVGGVIACTAIGLPPGLGDPIFAGMENRVASLVFGIPAVKGIEFGAGFQAAHQRGSEHNDPFYLNGGTVKTRTNHHGGILGGITSGMPLVFRVAIKPTPSIAMPQESVNLGACESAMLSVEGRHDPCIVPRAVPCVEAAVAIAVFDAMLGGCGLSL
ncbi:MAG: chorismate synthase [Oscillospiraceae bacterium]|nr:chorismate synthase [Oscillospiraceae bacterium]